MNKEIKYQLSFEEILRDLFTSGGWFQGEDFEDGVYIRSDNGIIKTYQFSSDWIGEKDLGSMITVGMYIQKYRRVVSQPDIMRK